jgi:hypothetical protein
MIERAWICCVEARESGVLVHRNVLCRGIHPLDWLTGITGQSTTVLLWYAETSNDRGERLRQRTQIEVVGPG